ncbi:MAG: aminotransferase class I/II-fold pyridoxal phosphate-dependent enzyme [Desulfobacteraceae bacterium]|nr:MAG: aminotransferase class I/II-fold pyridoxal phosphate-dependent enzyme [Desulfobacteraceae bacterium]
MIFIDKNKLEDLAIFGGMPLFEETLHVGRPNIMNREAVISRINQAMDRHWLSNDGPLVNEMEQRFAGFLQVKHAIAVTNATIGLQLAAKALDVKGEVIIPSFTFIGTAHAMAWTGLKIVFCDVLPENHTIDPEGLETKISENTGAIVGVHLWGNACQIDTLQKIADRFDVPLIFDAAHAIGSTYNKQRLGGFGNLSVFSLHATKAINSLEGGLVTTNDDKLADKIRLLRNYGFVNLDQVAMLGINAKMNEFSAAMGLTNLEEYDRLRAYNHELHAAYRNGISGLNGISMLMPAEGEDHNYHYAVFEVHDDASIRRDMLHRILVAENVFARRYFHPGCHLSPPYNLSEKRAIFPVTERLSATLLQLPTGLQMDLEKANCLSRLIRFCLINGAEIKSRLLA